MSMWWRYECYTGLPCIQLHRAAGAVVSLVTVLALTLGIRAPAVAQGPPPLRARATSSPSASTQSAGARWSQTCFTPRRGNVLNAGAGHQRNAGARRRAAGSLSAESRSEGLGEMQTGYDGSTGWIVSPITGPMLLQGKQLEQLRFESDFDAALHEEGFQALETVERTDFEGRPAYKVRALRKTGDEDFEFYDVETGFLVGSVVTRESPLGSVKATNVMSDYRAFGGLKIPTRQVQRAMGAEQVLDQQRRVRRRRGIELRAAAGDPRARR